MARARGPGYWGPQGWVWGERPASGSSCLSCRSVELPHESQSINRVNTPLNTMDFLGASDMPRARRAEQELAQE